jgi:hypothetical protein
MLLKTLFHPFLSLKKNSLGSVLMAYDVICNTFAWYDFCYAKLNFNSNFKMFEGAVKLILLESHDNTNVLIFA